MSLFDILTNKEKNSTRQLIGMDSIDEYCIVNQNGDKIAYLVVNPINLNVLSNNVITAKVDNLAKAIIELGTAEIICINSAQSYENNKRFLAQRILKESNDTVKELDKLDIEFLDEIQVKMATSREFLIKLHFYPRDTIQQVTYALEKARQIMTQSDFIVRVADQASIKRMLAIYFEQNIYEEEMQNFDGERFSPILEMKK